MSVSTLIHAPLPLAHWLADAAVDALIDEADLSPKPALVDRRGTGAHHDLHLGLMHASALALWPLLQGNGGGRTGPGRSRPAAARSARRIGREGERAMLATTGGVNTHRGAIWALACWSPPVRSASQAKTPVQSPRAPDASP
ncbi:triphosphoribosyl-dephospho-CoA synthase [Pseudomonas bharatica]|uniref:triphosphoribosyl-dephospho-CoA synthase n=1 Tax=Pseudomonas bharatica TaxID=2692112 RepID=UPI001F042563|nr:triphosphoribosyl-dephospho-CoA synthase [Pseudomonas bharatica]